MNTKILTNIKNIFNIKDDKILENVFKNILIITDLKLDDNLAIIELLNFMKKKQININIDIIVTSIDNFNKMINNLIFYESSIKTYINNEQIVFYEGKKEYKEKKHENIVKQKDYINNIKITRWNKLLKRKNKYSICFGFAPIQDFYDIFYYVNIAVLGHGYNTIIKNKNNKEDNNLTIKNLEMIRNRIDIILYINNFASFIEPGGKIDINNTKLNKIISNKNKKEIFDQGTEDEISFIVEQIKKAVNNLNNNYGYNMDLFEKKIRKIFNGYNKKDEELKLIMNIMKNGDEFLKNNNINNYMLKKIYKSVKTPGIEVTDWSQMLLFLNIFEKKNKL